MKNKMIPSGGALPESTAFSPEEQQVCEAKCLALLARRVGRYLAGDATSLPEHTAAALLRSLRYVVGQCGLSPHALAEADWNRLFEEGITRLQQKVEEGKRLYLLTLEHLPPIENQSLQETMASIADFWKQYDLRYFAAEIPCDIDYQLACPVPEATHGVDYILEYLRRIAVESDFLGRFSRERLAAFLSRQLPDYRELILNLYEPVASQAIGLTLAGEPVAGLCLSESGRGKIAAQFSLFRREEATERLTGAAAALSRQLGITAPEAKEYLSTVAQELSPRLLAALGRRK